jgi:hypothetical protein
VFIFRLYSMVASTLPNEKFIGVWIHDGKLSKNDHQRMMDSLKQTFHYFQIFVERGDLFAYIAEDRFVTKIILIISHMEYCRYIYELCQKQSDKFQNIYQFLPLSMSLDCLFKQIHSDIKSYFHEATNLSTSIFPSKRKTYIRHLSEDSRESLLFLTAIQILLSMTHDLEAIDEMLRICRDEYKDICIQLENIDKLKKYEAYKAIEYYTESTCLFRIVNQVLRIEDIKEIFPFRGFITDLHIQLKELN